jgi:uncharacterized protein
MPTPTISAAVHDGLLTAFTILANITPTDDQFGPRLNLPRICDQTTLEWRTQLLAELHELHAKYLADGLNLELTNTAQEVLFWWALYLAESHALNLLDAKAEDGLLGRTEWTDTEDAFEEARDSCYEDMDFLMLYNPAMDGIEDDDTTLSLLGISQEHILPGGWFTPFREQ